MKAKLLLTSFLAGASMMLSQSAQAQYCAATTSSGSLSGSYFWIKNVTFNTLNVTQTSYISSSPYYLNFAATGNQTTTVNPGMSYTLSVTEYYWGVIGAWIDWNNNTTFEASEFYLLGNSYTSSSSTYNNTWSQSIMVPAATSPGTKRMRIRTNYGAYSMYNYEPCTNFPYGETHDYTISVLPAVSNDAGIASIMSPALPTCDLDTVDITIALQNMGAAALQSCTIKYQIGSGTIVSTAYSGNVSSGGGLDTVTLGTVNFTNGQQLHVWTELPNGVTDSLSSNDNAYVTVSTGLSGTYGIPSDYATLQAAATALSTYGVCDDVVFNIASNTYTGQITFGPILGASEDATVTFRSATGNSSNVTIQYGSSSTTDNWVVKLNGSDWMRFEDLTVRNTGTNVYTNVFFFENQANNNIVQDSKIYSGAGTTQYGNYGNYMNGFYLIGVNNGNAILNNTIEYGSTAIYSNASASTRSIGLRIEGNQIRNIYYYTTYLVYTDGINFSDNSITATTSLYTLGYGLYMQYCDKFDITNNYIGSSLNYGYSYALYMTYCNGRNNPRSQVTNNCIVAGSPSQASYGYYGVIAQYSGIFDFHNNTVTRYGSAGNMAVYFYQNGLISVKNNNIASMVSGYALYNYGAFGMTDSDYNNLYTAGGTPFYFGTTTYSTLAAYQAASGFDAHSVQVDPSFQNVNTCVTCNESLDGGGTVLSNITEDIDGNNRSTSAPDIGAVEFVTGSSFNLGPDTTLCATTYTVEAGPAQLVLWNVNGGVTTGQSVVLDNQTGAPEDYEIMVNVTTLYCGSGSDTLNIRLVPNAGLGDDVHLCADEDATLTPGGGTGSTFAWSTGEVTSTISVTEPGTYSVTKVEEGCESTDEVVVTKSTAVEISDIDACEADAPISVDASIPDGTSYAWSGGSSTNTALNDFNAGGSYSVTATDSLGCTSSDSFALYLLTEPVPVITYVGSGGSLIMFSSASSQQVGSNSTYSWTFNGSTSNDPNPTYVFPWQSYPITYTVTLEIDNGCGIEVTSKKVTIDPLGIEQVAGANAFQVYPNPTSGEIFLSALSWSDLSVEVLDNAGRVVQSSAHLAGSGTIGLDTSALPAGSYMIRLVSDQSIEVHTLVKL